MKEWANLLDKDREVAEAKAKGAIKKHGICKNEEEIRGESGVWCWKGMEERVEN